MAKMRQLTSEERETLEEFYREYLWELSREDLSGLIEMAFEAATLEDMAKCLPSEDEEVVERLGFNPFC